MLKKYTDAELEEVLNSYLARLKKKISIDKAILFGSYAKGTATELSDIDLLIISNELSEKEPKGYNGYLLDQMIGGKTDSSLEVMGVHPNKLHNPILEDFFEEIFKTGREINIEVL